MRTRIPLVIGLLLTACSNPVRDPSEVSKPLTVSKPVSLAAGVGLALDEVSKRLKDGLYASLGAPPAVIIEYDSSLDTSGKYTLASSYPSLTALAANLESQYPRYKWEVLNGDVVVVRPVTGSHLEASLPAGTYDAEAFCDLLKTFGAKVFPNNKITRSTTCMYRGTPKYRPDMPARVLPAKTILGSGSYPTVSVSVAPGDRVIDAVVTGFDKFGFRFSAAVAPIMQSTSIPPTWILSF